MDDKYFETQEEYITKLVNSQISDYDLDKITQDSLMDLHEYELISNKIKMDKTNE